MGSAKLLLLDAVVVPFAIESNDVMITFSQGNLEHGALCSTECFLYLGITVLDVIGRLVLSPVR